MGDKTVSGTQKRSGFSETDVNTFLRRGNRLASQGENITSLTPQKKTQTARSTVDINFLGQPVSGTKTSSVSGFGGTFSKRSQEEVDLLANTFLQRERQIQSRRGQPGRKSLFLGRS